MKIYCSTKGDTVTAWIEDHGKRVWEADGDTLELAVGRLIYALSQRDDPNATPKVEIVEK
jgi:hypothetical protein